MTNKKCHEEVVICTPSLEKSLRTLLIKRVKYYESFGFTKESIIKTKFDVTLTLVNRENERAYLIFKGLSN